jgi:molybdopterin biosynthesis enzyme
MPPFDKAMMDGYAVRSADAGPLEVIEEVPAGKVPRAR